MDIITALNLFEHVLKLKPAQRDHGEDVIIVARCHLFIQDPENFTVLCSR